LNCHRNKVVVRQCVSVRDIQNGRYQPVITGGERNLADRPGRAEPAWLGE
jgi:hypothetical protein